MANIVNRPTSLRKEAEVIKNQSPEKTFYKKLLIYSVLSIFCYALKPVSNVFTIIGTLFFLKAVFSLLKVSSISKNKSSMMEAGHKGEIKTIEVLEELNDDYAVVTDLRINYRGKSSQIDSVVVGPNGLFIVETKNIRGDITGDYNDDKIKIKKDGISQEPIYNPIKQVSTHRERLIGLLKENKIDVDVNAAVFFVNNNSNVNIKSDDIPVFNYKDDYGKDLLHFISEYNGPMINHQSKERIINILEAYII